MSRIGFVKFLFIYETIHLKGIHFEVIDCKGENIRLVVKQIVATLFFTFFKR